MHCRPIPNAITFGELCFLPVFLWIYGRQAPGASRAAAAIVLVLARLSRRLARAPLRLDLEADHHEGGKLANFILVCGIQFFIIDVRAVDWPVYGVGATLYLVRSFRYIWRAFADRERAVRSQRRAGPLGK